MYLLLGMPKKQSIQLFEERKVRTIWGDEHEKWYFSIVDVVAVLTEQTDQWATSVLREFAIRGYVLDKKRMENGSILGEDYLTQRFVKDNSRTIY